MTHILIVEDNALFRQTLRKIIIQRFPSMTVAEASDGREALTKIDREMPETHFYGHPTSRSETGFN